MKIAVASQNQTNITSHTGKCRNFWIYEVNSQEILSKKLLRLSREESFLNSFPHIPYALNNIQVLISGGIGCGLRLRLEEEGIDSIVTSESEPDLAVITYLESFLVNKLAQLHNRKRRDNPRSDRRQHLHGHAYQLPTMNFGKTV